MRPSEVEARMANGTHLWDLVCLAYHSRKLAYDREHARSGKPQATSCECCGGPLEHEAPRPGPRRKYCSIRCKNRIHQRKVRANRRKTP